MLPKPPTVQIYYIPKISLCDIVSVFSDGKMVDASAKFADVADQPAFFAVTDTQLFKKSIHKVFPGGAFAKINVLAPGLGTMKRWCGCLWQAPAFRISQLQGYYTKFGCTATVEKLNIRKQV